MSLWRFFVRKENIELRDEKTQDRTLKEAVYGRKPRKSKVWLSPPREKGGVTAKNLYGCGGRCEGRGERDEGWDEISA